jgi:hypothetical protein
LLQTGDGLPEALGLADGDISFIQHFTRLLIEALKMQLYVLHRSNLPVVRHVVEAASSLPAAAVSGSLAALRQLASHISGKAHLVGSRWGPLPDGVAELIPCRDAPELERAMLSLTVWLDLRECGTTLQDHDLRSCIEITRNADTLLQLAKSVRAYRAQQIGSQLPRAFTLAAVPHLQPPLPRRVLDDGGPALVGAGIEKGNEADQQSFSAADAAQGLRWSYKRFKKPSVDSRTDRWLPLHLNPKLLLTK